MPRRVLLGASACGVAVSYRTTIIGLVAGLSFLAAALSQDGPWTAQRILAVVAGVLVAALGAVARDAAAPPPPPLPAPSGSSRLIVDGMSLGSVTVSGQPAPPSSQPAPPSSAP